MTRRITGLMGVLLALLSPFCEAQDFAHPPLTADGGWNRIEVTYTPQIGSPYPVKVEKWDPNTDDADGDGEADENEWKQLQEASCPATAGQWKWTRKPKTGVDAAIDLGAAPANGVKIRIKSTRQPGTPTPGTQDIVKTRKGPAPCDPA